MSVTVTPAASHNKGQNGALRILKTLCFTYSTVLLTWVTSHALVFPQNINANYKPLVCPCPSSRNHHSGVETPILNSEMQSLWLGADVTLFPWCCAREDTSTSRSHCVRGPGAVRSRAPLGGAPGGPAASAPGVPPTSGSPGTGSPVRCHGLRGPLATTTAWLSWRARPFRGSTALPGCADIPKRLRAGLGRRRRSLGSSTGSPRRDFSRGFSTAPPAPLSPSAPAAAPAMAALRRLLWPPPRLSPTLGPQQPFLSPWGRPAGTAPGLSGRPFSCREDDEGAVAEAAWRRRRWGELSIAAAAGGGLVGLVCYQLYGDPRAEPSELAAQEPEDPPRARGLLPIPVAAAKETVSAWARARRWHRRVGLPGVPPAQGGFGRQGSPWHWAVEVGCGGPVDADSEWATSSKRRRSTPGVPVHRDAAKMWVMLSVMHQDHRGCCSDRRETKCKPDSPSPHTCHK